MKHNLRHCFSIIVIKNIIIMETIIEQQRRCHEERERLVNAMTQELLVKKTNSKEQINSDHRVHFLLDRHTEVTGM